MGNKVIKVIRKISGNEIKGDVSHPLYYSGYSLSQTIREVRAYFDNSLIGQTAVFLINTNLSEIENIPLNDKASVSQTANWIYYSSSAISSDAFARTEIDLTQLSTFAISAYCSVTDIGDPIQIELGN